MKYFLLFLMMATCQAHAESENYVESVQIIRYLDHQYLAFDTGCVLHDPDCPCTRKCKEISYFDMPRNDYD